GSGIFLALRKQPPPARSVVALLSFGFLVLLLLHVSKFKHVNGFGFDAETWDEKQVEAAQLVDQLSSTSEALSQQVALLASRVGLWDAGLTNPELAALLQQTDKQLIANNKTISASRRNAILVPIRVRVSANYWHAAVNIIDAAYINKSNEIRTREDL